MTEAVPSASLATACVRSQHDNSRIEHHDGDPCMPALTRTYLLLPPFLPSSAWAEEDLRGFALALAFLAAALP